MAFVALTADEVDPKSPIDDTLMGKIKADLDDLNSRVVAAGSAPTLFELIGKLKYVSGQRRSICMGLVTKEFTPTQVRMLLKKSGTSGALSFDLRRHTSPKSPIIGINSQYSAGTTSIGQSGTAIVTQSIGRATAQIATQSITHAKASNNVQSIVDLGSIEGLGDHLWQYNLATAIDSDTLVGDSFVAAGSTDPADDGTFTILEINRGGNPSVVISNASGVAQPAAAGTVQIKIMSYNFANPVDPNFAAGFLHLFASHTNGANDGTLPVYALNSSGNNIWVKNSIGVLQAGVAGNANSNFWLFGSTPAVSAADFVVGERAKASGHTSGGNNNGFLQIIALNQGGNNIVLYNTAGVAQGGALGSVNTNRWTYTQPSNPTSQISVGDFVYLSGHSTNANNGLYDVKAVNSAAIVIYNPNGVIQSGAAGTTATTRKVVSFATDQSAFYTTDSFVEMQGCISPLYNYYWAYAPFKVLQINRGGGANHNIVIDVGDSLRFNAPEQVNPSGYVQVEMKSLFSATPSLAVDLTALVPNQNIVGQSTSMVATVIPAQTPILLYLLSVPNGDPQDLTVSLL